MTNKNWTPWTIPIAALIAFCFLIFMPFTPGAVAKVADIETECIVTHPSVDTSERASPRLTAGGEETEVIYNSNCGACHRNKAMTSVAAQTPTYPDDTLSISSTRGVTRGSQLAKPTCIAAHHYT